MINMAPMDSNNRGEPHPSFLQQQDEALLLIALQEFDAQLPTEEAAREDVKIRLEKENLLFCHECNSHNLEKKYGARVLKCLDCGSKTWITAGTFFHHAKRVKPRLAALWLMERGFIVSSSKLHKLTDIAQSSAFYILKRVAIVIEAHLERNICEIPSAVFSKIICKRSRETPARAHPLAEQEEIDALEQKQHLEQEQYWEQEQQENLQEQLSERHQEKRNTSSSTSLQEQLLPPQPVSLQPELEPEATEVTSPYERPSNPLNRTGLSDIADSSDRTSLTDTANSSDRTSLTDIANSPSIASLTDTADSSGGTGLTKNTDSISQPANTSLQDSTYNQLSPQEKTLYDLLSESPVSFEELYIRSNMSVANATASLVMLEIAGLASCLPGNNYIRCANNKNSQEATRNKISNEALEEFKTIALAIENFIRNSFHGISRKYLQDYLSIHWYHIDKSFWQIGSLFNACFRFRPVKLTEIISYVTPPTIKYCKR